MCYEQDKNNKLKLNDLVEDIIAHLDGDFQGLSLNLNPTGGPVCSRSAEMAKMPPERNSHTAVRECENVLAEINTEVLQKLNQIISMKSCGVYLKTK